MLQEAHELQLFNANQRLLLDWSLKQRSALSEKGLPKTRAEADRLLAEHRDWKVRVWLPADTRGSGNTTLLTLQTEIDARAERLDSVRDFGLGLIRSGHGSKAEIQKALKQLEEAKGGLERAWLDRGLTLEQAHTLTVRVQILDERHQ